MHNERRQACFMKYLNPRFRFGLEQLTKLIVSSCELSRKYVNVKSEKEVAKLPVELSVISRVHEVRL